MSPRSRIILQIALSIPAIVFYGLVFYPWDFQHNRGAGWFILLVLYLIIFVCIMCSFVAAYYVWKDEKKWPWVVIFALNIYPLFNGLIIPILSGYVND